MKIKNFKLIIGVVIICVLCGVYYGLTVYNEKSEQAEEEAAEGEVILEVDTSTLTAVTYTIDGEQVSFTLQEDGSWQKDDDETFPVDSSALLAPLEEAAELKSIRTLTDIEDTSEYGLDEPQNTITLTDEDGEETVITIGDNNASTGNDYLMLNEDTSTVYTVSTDLSSAFTDDIYDYAESEEIPTLQASTITGVRLEETDGEGYDLYIEDAVWMVSSVDGADDGEADAEAETETEAAEAETADAEEETADEMETEAVEAGTETETEEADTEAEIVNEEEEAAEETETEAVEDESETEEESEDEVTAEELAAGVEADADEADTLTTALASLAYVDFLDHNCTDFSEYGLDEPTAILTITYEEEVEDEEEDSEETETEDADDEEESETETETEDSVETIERTVTFQIGYTDDNGNYYVRMEDSLEVHTISSTVLSTVFGYTASDLIAPEEEETETEVETEADEETEIEVETEADEETEIETDAGE